MLINRNTCLWSNRDDAFQYINEKRIATSYSYIWKWDICYVTSPELNSQNIIDLILLTLCVLTGTVKHVAQKPWSLSQQFFSYACPYTPLMWVLTLPGRLGLLAWLQTCLIPTDLCVNPGSRLKAAAIPGPALLTLLGCSGTVLVRALPRPLCCCLSSCLTFPYTAVWGETRLSGWSVVGVQQRHLGPLTLISLPVITWQKQTRWGPEANLYSVQIRVCDKQSHWGGPNNIQGTKSLCQIQLFWMS